jgi:uncharacterized glyoxalase superfamily protein PhnB
LSAPAVDQVDIVAGDLDATVAFYRLLGVDLQNPFRAADGEPFHTSCKHAAGALPEADSPRFARLWNRGWEGEERLEGRVVIGLRVADRAEVDRLADAVVRSGYRLLQPACDAFWRARYAIVEDPDGVAVGLMSPAEDGFRSAPPIL